MVAVSEADALIQLALELFTVHLGDLSQISRGDCHVRRSVGGHYVELRDWNGNIAAHYDVHVRAGKTYLTPQQP